MIALHVPVFWYQTSVLLYCWLTQFARFPLRNSLLNKTMHCK